MASHTLDMTQGSVAKKLVQFAVPIWASGVLQHLYSIADRVVVGNFAENGTVALAAVGSTSSATNLLLNLFMGISIGVNVVCSNFRGAKEDERLRKSMHSAVLLSLIFGVVLCFVGLVLAEPFLTLMGTPADVLPKAATYMRIFFLGMPGSLVYNFGAAILRSHGDAKRTMYILGCTGIVNVLLNLLLVVVVGLDVEGVAIATIVAQYLSAVAVLWILFSKNQEYKLQLRQIRLHWGLVWKMVAIGVPCGISGILQNTSNVILQSSVNSFGSADIIAGNTAATDINQFSYLVISAFTSACVSFAGQCCGAKEYKRIDKLVVTASLVGCCVIAVFATVFTLFPLPLMGIFNPDPDVARAGLSKLYLCSWGAILYLIAECCIGCARGMGKSAVSTVLNVIALCGVRVLWVFCIFPLHRQLWFLYLCYPVSWLIGMVMHLIYYLHCRKKLTTI